MDKIRLDVLMVERKIAESRRKAHDLIKAGLVRINQEEITKPSAFVPAGAEIEIEPSLMYVSRAGLKLKEALDKFQVNVKNLVIADIGSSTGGFTDCLLCEGARKIYAIDIGHDLLHEKLRNDPRVKVYENADILSLKHLSELVDLAVVDLSYLSLILALPMVQQLVKPTGQMVVLIKPQFEVGPKKRDKSGIVKDEKFRLEAVEKIKHWAIANHWLVKGIIESPLRGHKAGNIEYLALLAR